MGRECSTHREKRNAHRILWESQKERDHYKELDEGDKIILK
jgi:hypothetical protein